jgi:hypothetical protein
LQCIGWRNAKRNIMLAMWAYLLVNMIGKGSTARGKIWRQQSNLNEKTKIELYPHVQQLAVGVCGMNRN